MTVTGRPMMLAGLVSAEAEEIYQRLLVAGSARTGLADDELDPSTPGIAELLELGIVFRSEDDRTVIRSVDPPAALRLLIEARQDEMISFQSRILEGWTRLTRLLPTSLDAPVGRVDGVRVLTRAEEIVACSAELYSSCQRHLRCTETGTFPTRPRSSAPIAVQAGRRAQMIYDADYPRTGAGAVVVDRSVTAGEEVRLRNRLPIKMLHVDDNGALVAADRSGRSAILVRAKPMLAMLADWFDMLWQHPATMTYPVGGTASGLTDAQRDVLTLMPSCDDETIARRLELSVTTVRRHIKAIYRALDVNNRFAAGTAAAKLNWL